MDFTKDGVKVVVEKPSEQPLKEILFKNRWFFRNIDRYDKILIKINIPYWKTPPGSATKKETLWELWDFCKRFNLPQFIVESRYSWTPIKVDEDYQFRKEYVIDLFEKPSIAIKAFTINNNKLSLHLSKEVLNPKNFIITLGPPKTHEYVIYTGALKTAMGFLKWKKRHMHGFSNLSTFGSGELWYKSVKCLHKNLIKLNDEIPGERVSILDGTSCMEGNGPVFGNEVHWNMIAISNDAPSLDYVVSSLMGFDPTSIAYIWWFMQDDEYRIKNLPYLDSFLFKLGLQFNPSFERPPNYEKELSASLEVIKEFKELII